MFSSGTGSLLSAKQVRKKQHSDISAVCCDVIPSFVILLFSTYDKELDRYTEVINWWSVFKINFRQLETYIFGQVTQKQRRFETCDTAKIYNAAFKIVPYGNSFLTEEMFTNIQTRKVQQVLS